MSLSNLNLSKTVRFGLMAGFIAALAGCQVTPLYSSATSTSLPAIEISDADDRLEQVVRNQLVFLNGGANRQGTSDYKLELNVTRRASGVLDSGTDNNFTAGRMVASGTYKLTKFSDGTVLRDGKRTSTALYDLPDQEFSKIRALRDAEDRAGRELAELIYADLAIALRK